MSAASRIVTGQSRNPRFETGVCIAHAVGITVGWLLEEHSARVSKPLDVYDAVAPVIRQVRPMDRFFAEVVDEHKYGAKVYDDLRLGYTDILNREFAPHAFLLAVAIRQLGDAYPEIERPEVPERATAG